MKIAILGGDGFVGWPTTLHLSNLGHEVHIIDNLSRRWIDTELGVQSLTPMDSIQERCRIWYELTGRRLHFHLLDLAREYERVKAWLTEHRPDAVVHFAEQRAAPYSMKSDRHKVYTVNNNVNATHNLLAALVESGVDAHVVHLGTMGVYGYSSVGATIPEGYLDVDITTPDGAQGPAADPLPDASRLGLPHDQEPRSDPLPVLRPERRPPDHRPASGHRLGHPHRPDPPARAAHQPLRLRRRLRHGAEPLPDPGGDRLPAHRPRHGRPDPRLHPHPGQRALHRACAGHPAPRGRPGRDLQPDDRNPPRPRPRGARGQGHRRPRRLPAEPAQGSGGERPRGGQLASSSASASSPRRSPKVSSAKWWRSPASSPTGSTGAACPPSRPGRATSPPRSTTTPRGGGSSPSRDRRLPDRRKAKPPTSPS